MNQASVRSTTSLLTVFILLAACSSEPKRNPASSSVSSSPASSTTELREGQDEKLLTEWQEQKKKNYFNWPVDEARMTRGYLPNRRKPHLGIDLAATKGTNIYAAHDGTVIYAGRDFRGFGQMVLIEGTRGWATLYAHFSKFYVRQGQRVQQGDVIGGMGRTGRATGVHLHFEIRKARGPVDPLLYLPGGTRLAGH
jgi:murein DD-endopeptidase MepM/ murein hydrolase activator NlpD